MKKKLLIISLLLTPKLALAVCPKLSTAGASMFCGHISSHLPDFRNITYHTQSGKGSMAALGGFCQALLGKATGSETKKYYGEEKIVQEGKYYCKYDFGDGELIMKTTIAEVTKEDIKGVSSEKFSCPTATDNSIGQFAKSSFGCICCIQLIFRTKMGAA